MEDLIRDEASVAIKKIIKDINAKRLANKDKWVMDKYCLVDVPNYTVYIKYKMYNTWVQILELEVISMGERAFIRDSSPMDMKPTAFKAWLDTSLKALFRSLYL